MTRHNALRLNITLGSIIPKMGGIPPSAGFARSTYSPKQVRKPTIAKANKPSWLFLVEKNTLLDKEISMLKLGKGVK